MVLTDPPLFQCLAVTNMTADQALSPESQVTASRCCVHAGCCRLSCCQVDLVSEGIPPGAEGLSWRLPPRPFLG